MTPYFIARVDEKVILNMPKHVEHARSSAPTWYMRERASEREGYKSYFISFPN